MNDVVQYSIIRFRPLPETGEFANVGIVLFDRKERQFLYKIVPKRFRRVTQFFNTLHPNVFASSITLLQSELDRLSAVFQRSAGDAITVLENFLRQGRESVWTFSDIRALLADAPLEDVLDRLYETYVGRNFINFDYQELIMVREIRAYLRRRSVFDFTERVIEDEIVPVKFPLVSETNGTRVIKPISLSQRTTLGIIDHSATWHDRFRLLIKRNRLTPENVLIPMTGPVGDDSALQEAFSTAKDEFSNLGVSIVDRSDVDAVLNFAKRRPEHFLSSIR